VNPTAATSPERPPSGGPARLITAPRRAFFNMVAKGASMAIERGAQLVLVLVAAPLLGPAAYGRFSFAASLAVLLGFGTDLGLTIWTTRALARDPAAGPGVLGTGLRLRLGATAVVLCAFAGVALASDQPDVRWAILALGGAALARAFLDHARAVFRAHERLDDEGKVNVVIAFGSTLGGLGALALAGPSVAALAAGVLGGTLAGAVYGFLLLGHRYGPWAGPGDAALARRMLRESLPFWLAGIFSLLYARGDVVLLKLLSTDAEVGAYRIAGQLAEVVKQAPVLLLTALFPQLARAFAEPGGRLERLERHVTRLLVGGGLAAALLLAGVSGPLIRHYAPAFARTIPALRVLAISVPLAFMNAGLLHFFVARDRGTLNALLTGAMVLVNLTANLLFARPFGAVGSALATLSTEAALGVSCLYALHVLRREARVPDAGPPLPGAG
jgi:O-antigen/teichoic acid export membrane protein